VRPVERVEPLGREAVAAALERVGLDETQAAGYVEANPGGKRLEECRLAGLRALAEGLEIL